MKHLNAAKRLQLYRALINAREYLNNEGILMLLSLNRDSHIQRHYSPAALQDHTRDLCVAKAA